MAIPWRKLAITWPLATSRPSEVASPDAAAELGPPLSVGSSMVRRALPALLALAGVTLLGISLLDWAHYTIFLVLLEGR